MGEILSQNEIDDLLKALSAGELDVQELQTTTQEKKIKPLDFSRPNKFAKEHIRTLHIINENYARLVATFLSGYLRTPVQMEVVNVEALPYVDFTNSISNPVILAIVDFAPLSGSIIMEMQPNIAFALIDRLLGGKGGSIERIRSFSEIEQAIIERIIIQILNLMREPWENVVQLRPRLERMETDAQLATIIGPNEMIALISIKVKVGEVEGLINICIPHMVVEPVISKLSTKFWYAIAKKEVTPETISMLERKVATVKVPLKVLLGKTVISVGEFVDLQNGDVIQLDTSVNSNLEILVGDLLKFHGQPGVKKNKVAVKITDVERKEED